MLSSKVSSDCGGLPSPLPPSDFRELLAVPAVYSMDLFAWFTLSLPCQIVEHPSLKAYVQFLYEAFLSLLRELIPLFVSLRS